MIVIRLTSGWSVRLTASESMLKLRARISDDDAVQDARLVEDDRDQRVAAGLAATGQRPRRRRGVGGRWAGAAPDAALERRRRRCAGTLPFELGSASLVRPVPLLDQVGQALAGRHHREDVLLLGDLEPDERRAVDRLGGPDRVVDLVRRRGPERRDPERVGELGEVRAGQMGRVVVARRR